MELSLRKATVEDAYGAAQVVCEAWRAAFQNILAPEELAQQTDAEWRAVRLEAMVSEPVGCFDVALDGDTVCGVCLYGPCRDDGCDGIAEIIALHVLPSYWSTGVAPLLMARALEELTRRGFHHVLLWTFEDNARARRFYEKCGFACERDEAGAPISKGSAFGKVKEIRFRRDLP